MKLKWISLCLLLGFSLLSCTNTNNNGEVDDTLKTEIETLENEVDSLSEVKDEIDASAAKVDSLLKELN